MHGNGSFGHVGQACDASGFDASGHYDTSHLRLIAFRQLDRALDLVLPWIFTCFGHDLPSPLWVMVDTVIGVEVINVIEDGRALTDVG